MKCPRCGDEMRRQLFSNGVTLWRCMRGHTQVDWDALLEAPELAGPTKLEVK